MSLTLILANKTYSSWSLRPWILLRQLAIPFDEVVIPLAQPQTRADILRFAPSGKCPALLHGEIAVWDSLAIIEYVAETFPDFSVWPKARAARAQARSLSAEMHSGFVPLRKHLPMNMRRGVRKLELTAEVGADVQRLEEAFAETRASFGAGGPFLFGDFCAADAMFAPVASRLHVYDVAVSAPTRAYTDALMALGSFQEWKAAAEAEPWTIEKFEIA